MSSTSVPYALENRSLTFVSTPCKNYPCRYPYEGSHVTQTKAIWDTPKGQQEEQGGMQYPMAHLRSRNVPTCASLLCSEKEDPLPPTIALSRSAFWSFGLNMFFGGLVLSNFIQFSIQYYSRLYLWNATEVFRKIKILLLLSFHVAFVVRLFLTYMCGSMQYWKN